MERCLLVVNGFFDVFRGRKADDKLLKQLVQESLGGVRLSGCGRSVSLPESCGRALVRQGIPLAVFVNGSVCERDYKGLDEVAARFWELYGEVEAELEARDKRAYEQTRPVAKYYSEWKKAGVPPNRCLFHPDWKAQEAISGVIVDILHSHAEKAVGDEVRFDMRANARKIGNCLVACLYYVSIARRFGLNADLYAVPGHFIAGFSAGRDVKYADPSLGQKEVAKVKTVFELKDGGTLEVDYRHPRMVDCCGLAPAYRNKGFVLMERGKHREAFEALKKAVELDPSYADAWNVLGQLSLICENYDAALRFYEASLRLDKGQTAAWNGKGFALAGLGRHKEALEALETVLRMDPKNATALGKKMELLEGPQGSHAQVAEKPRPCPA